MHFLSNLSVAALHSLPDFVQTVLGMQTQQMGVSSPKMLGTFIRLSSGFYYPHPRVVGRLNFEKGRTISPLTVIRQTEPKISKNWLEGKIANFESRDDVFSRDFLSEIVFTHGQLSNSSTETELDAEVLSLLKSYGVSQYHFEGAQTWPAGPYFSDGNNLLEAWKLYPDTSEAFYLATVPDSQEHDAYEPLLIAPFAPVPSIAVPSRLYFEKSIEKPFNGFRVAVKDIFDLKGVKTAGSSRSYGELYPPRDKSAAVVDTLIKKGAIIVGKTKTTTFADREIPTTDWIDTHAPFNPRGDGYLVPGGSSAGSGAALSSYNWLDFAIGTDTSGSIRWPAAHGGLYGFKPTFNALPMTGIIPSSLQFDVPAFLSRDIGFANYIARNWFGQERFREPDRATAKRPTKLLYPVDYADPSRERTMSTNLQVLRVFEDFVVKLEQYLGIKRTSVDFSALWKEKNPHGSGESFDEYFNKTYEYILNYDSWQNNRAFVTDYQKKFGKDPYLPPSIANRWKFGRDITKADRDRAVAQVNIYKDWFEQNVLREDEEAETLSSAILVLPWTAGFANYRDIPRPIPNDSFGHGFWSSYITSFTTGPEIVFPIGTWKYESKITHREERLPVSAGIVGAPGADFGILSFVQDFIRASDIPDHVITGVEVFEQDKTSTLRQNL